MTPEDAIALRLYIGFWALACLCLFCLYQWLLRWISELYARDAREHLSLCLKEWGETIQTLSSRK